MRGRLTRKISSPIGRLDYARVQIVGRIWSSRSPSAARRCCRRPRARTASCRWRTTARASRPAPSGGLAVWLSRSNFSRSSTGMKRNGASGRRSTCTPRGIEIVPLDAALGRVLAADVVSPVDVPSFDRSNVDGFAVVAEDTFGASEEVPRMVRLGDEEIHTGIVPTHRHSSRQGGADRHRRHGAARRRCGCDGRARRERAAANSESPGPSPPGSGVSFAGTDITAGETVLRRGQLLTSRDTGVLAAIGVANVNVWRKPIVAILSTGDEIIAPGEPMQPAKVYDSNGAGARRRRAGTGRRAEATGHHA